MFTFMTISNKSVTWQSSATLIIAVIIRIKSLFSPLAFKLNIFKPPVCGIAGNHFYHGTCISGLYHVYYVLCMR